MVLSRMPHLPSQARVQEVMHNKAPHRRWGYFEALKDYLPAAPVRGVKFGDDEVRGHSGMCGFTQVLVVCDQIELGCDVMH